MNFKTKASRVGTKSLAMLVLRIIDTVIKSAIKEARESKQFLNLVEVNGRYQLAIEPGNESEVSKALKTMFKERKTLFNEIYDYLEGLLNSPDPEMKAAATLLFGVMNKFGKSYSKFKFPINHCGISGSLKR